ncbi:MAG: hypothetical protein JSS20_04930 [Proteobacteria bacterium]|nr:hypothetical protein [Pseudomonadota bacterium]
MTDGLRLAIKRVGQAAALTSVLALAGCSDGFGGVELNGKIFETVGLTGSLGKKEEPRTEPRSPLVLPPPGEKLPEPGQAVAMAPAPQTDPQWPNDPDKTKAAQAAAKSKAQQDYCKGGGNWKEKAMDPYSDGGQGPEGSCSGNIFKWIGGKVFGE